jgi:hypothetical protein
MTENNDEQSYRSLHTHDLLSGEELDIVYFIKSGVVTINGFTVTRSPKLEDSVGQAVFHRDLGDKLFTVETDKFGRLFL